MPKLVKAAGCTGWSPFWRNVDAAGVAEARALGLAVVPWTVNEAAEMGRLIELGVDGLITDYPDRLRRCWPRRASRCPDAGPRRSRAASAAEPAAALRYFASPSTSAPFGGTNRNVSGGSFGLRCIAVKRMLERWPNASSRSSATSPRASNPRRISANAASFASGVAASQSSPSAAGRSCHENAFSTSSRPDSSAAGVAPSASRLPRTMTCCRSSS